MAKFNDEGSAASSPRNLKPGDTFTWSTRDEDTKQISRTYTLVRTHRPYVDDLCDAYNAAREPDSVFVSYVDKQGNIRLGRRDQNYSSGREWKPEDGETQAIQANIARLRAKGVTQAEFNALVDAGRV